MPPRFPASPPHYRRFRHFFPSLSTRILEKSVAFSDCFWRSTMRAGGSNTYPYGRCEDPDGVNSRWAILHRVWQAGGRVYRACLDDRIMLSKAASSVRYQRSHYGRCSEVIAIPSWQGCIYTPSNIYKKSNPQHPWLWRFRFVVYQQHFYKA